jgi:GTP cyclohydrolase I
MLWEEKMMDKRKIEEGVRMILEAIGEDPNRPGLIHTPTRVAEMFEEIFGGINENPADHLKITLPDVHEEMVLARDIPFYSICEHHLIPFFGKAHVAYLPKGGRIVGLSKIARVVDVMARRPQLQERLTTDIAELLMETLGPFGVLVIIEAEHLCMTMRGIKKPGCITTTSAVRGAFEKEATRSEALKLIKG